MAQKDSSGTPWHSGRQEDAPEFLLALLAVLREELQDFPGYNTVLKSLYGVELEKRKFLDNPPSGRCLRCDTYPSSTHEEFLALLLPVPNCNAVELSSLLQSHYNDQDDALRMKCSECCTCRPECQQKGFCSRPAVTHRALTYAPSTLLVLLKRFNNGPNGVKVTTLVKTEASFKVTTMSWMGRWTIRATLLTVATGWPG